ncbi:MAG: type II toxin-antitoxin system RelE/ParE family toxin [Verrucomicrobia bacterium]|nr:type II toxin-antitoxin system RelE/ParE family toxin [Verrucomicrobiota bacterium]
MAHKIIWSLDAREDLREIVTFIRQDNPDAAAAFGHALICRVDILETFPLLGRRVPEFDDDKIRELIHRSYRIIYLVMDEQRSIAIARVWHGARGEPQVPAQLQF